MTRACEEFELDLVMRAHGALVPAAAGTLEEHLSGCVACRTFAEGGSDVEDALRRIAARDAETVDWEGLRGGIRSLESRQRWKVWLSPLFLLQVPLVMLLGTGQLPTGALLFVGPPATVALYVGWIWLMGRPFREILAVVTAEDELLVAYRRELVRQRARARLFAAVTALFAAVGIVAFIRQPAPAAAVVALFFAGWAALDLLWKLPRLGRALAEVRS